MLISRIGRDLWCFVLLDLETGDEAAIENVQCRKEFVWEENVESEKCFLSGLWRGSQWV